MLKRRRMDWVLLRWQPTQQSEQTQRSIDQLSFGIRNQAESNARLLRSYRCTSGSLISARDPSVLWRSTTGGRSSKRMTNWSLVAYPYLFTVRLHAFPVLSKRWPSLCQRFSKGSVPVNTHPINTRLDVFDFGKQH